MNSISKKTRYPLFDTSTLNLLPLAERRHGLDLTTIKALSPVQNVEKQIQEVAKRIVRAKNNDSSVILMMGAHVLRSGVQRYIIDLMERGMLSCVAFNGACAIHDYEFALIGKTTESVAKYVKEGQFGLWSETGDINTIVNQGAENGLGYGEAVGKAILAGEFPHKDISVFAAAYRLGIPATVHVGIGSDIIHEHPNFNGAACGKASGLDFLIFAKVLEKIENGVVMNFGSAVMAPEVYLKAFSMVRNVAKQENREVRKITTLVCDLYTLPEDFHSEPLKETTGYYFRPWKTMLVRTVADGGSSYYVRGDHANTIPQLWTAINSVML